MRPRLKHAPPLPAGFFLTDAERTPDPLAVIRGLPAGTAVIFRHYGVADRSALARAAGRLCRARHLLFLVAGDLALARRAGAAGLHLPEWQVRRGRPHGLAKHWILTASAHSIAGLNRAALAGADAVLAGPVFATASHPGAPALGPHRLGRMVDLARLPVYALGGVTRQTIRRLPRQKLAGVAGIQEFLGRAAAR